MFDFVILGGGLSGLLTYHKLRKHGFKKIIILEAGVELGGRIQTEWTKAPGKTWLDRGAARFHSSQKRLFQLLKEYKLNHLISPLPPTPVHNLSIEKWETIRKLLKENPQKTPREIIQDDAWIHSTGYFDDFELTSASSFLSEWSHYHPTALDDWYELQGGLSQLIHAISRKIPKKSIVLREHVNQIVREGDVWRIFGDQQEYECSGIILAIPPHAAMKLLPDWGFPYESQSLIRIFVRGKGELDWLKDHPIYYRRGGGQCLSLGERTDKTGWFELYYSAGEEAVELLNEYLMDKPRAVRKYERGWKEMTGESLSIEEVSAAYWRNGVEWYSPRDQSVHTYLKELRKKGRKESLYFVGDSWSESAGWMEGCLESLEKQQFPIKGGAQKNFTMEEVAKHHKENDAWIAIRGKVYDITEWIPLHPGGLVIMKGVGKDATQLFERAHPNLELPRKILKKYLIGKLKV